MGSRPWSCPLAGIQVVLLFFFFFPFPLFKKTFYSLDLLFTTALLLCFLT